LLLGSFVSSCSQGPDQARVEMNVNEGARSVEVRFDGELFTSYIFPENLEKPVLFPVMAPGGVPVTRGFPLESREGERVDHPHHVGIWFNHGNVNGFDFWNNSFAVKPDHKDHFGRIRHEKIVRAGVKDNTGFLEVIMAWMAPDTEGARELLEEHTTFRFQGAAGIRVVDRITRLKAVADRVVFLDNKEGMLAIRTARAFEHPAEKPEVFTDAEGNPTGVPVLDNQGVTGCYRNSEGIEGTDVWGKSARWVKLSAEVGDKSYAIVMMDHPGNMNYPSCWHARGYGLFSVNNLGRKVYNDELDPVELVLHEGEEVQFRHRVVVMKGNPSDQEIEQIFSAFTEG
jgi:hypothetical protein